MPEPLVRRRSRLALSVAFLIAGLVGATPALAHKLKVFASAAGARIEGNAYFAGGSPAAGATVLIQDSQGRVLATLDPDEDGGFGYQAQAPVGHVVVARTDDGHEARWSISADELAPGFASAKAAEPEAPPSDAGLPSPPSPSAPPNGPPVEPQPPTESRSGLDPQLTATIEQAVARQVRPLREALNAAQDQARLHDILGGLGYILGLTGLALWMRGRGAGRRP